jgi:hypothetical protein
MRYNPETDGDVLDLLEAGFTEAPVDLGSDGPVSVFSPPALQENPVQAYRETTQQMLTLGVRYLSVNVERFTDIPKIGLNPRNQYDTPTGLYWYDRDMEHADFATDRRYVIRATLAGSGVDLGTLDDYAVDNLMYAIEQTFKIRPAWAIKKRIDITYDDVEKQSASFVKSRVRYAAENGLDQDAARAAAMWWAVTRLAAKRLAKREERKLVDAWTTIFRSLGINFVYDPGFGVIHTAEPAQVVSFEPRVVQDAQLEEVQKKKKKRTKLPPIFKFLPTKYRFRADEETGLTAQQRIETEGVRPCEAMQLLFVDRAARSFTRRTVGVGDVVAFALTTQSANTEPLNLKIDMVLHDKVLVSLVEDDGEPLSSKNLLRLYDADFFANGMWRKTFFQCGTFGEVSVVPSAFDDPRYFDEPRRACRIIENTVVSGADFSGASFKQLSFENCYFPKASFSSAEFLDVTFHNCYLRDATFEDAEMADVSFDRCLPQDADFSDVEVRRVTADLVTHAQILKTSGDDLKSWELDRSRAFRDIRWQSFWPELKPDDKIDTAEMMEPPATRRRDPFRRVIEQLSAAAPPDADDGLVDEAPESW